MVGVVGLVVMLDNWFQPAPLSDVAALRAQLEVYHLSPITKIPQDPALVRLGQALFFDKELSGSRNMSCATCHHPAWHTGDGLAVSIGVGGLGLGPVREYDHIHPLVPRNAPDLFNRGHPAWRTMFWDSRVSGSPEEGFDTPAEEQLLQGLANVLAVQAMFPVTSDAEMLGEPDDTDLRGHANELAFVPADNYFSGIWDSLMQRVLQYDGYRILFTEAYPETPLDELNFANAANALAAYQIDAFTLIDSPWNEFLTGNDDALAPDAIRGAQLFYGEAWCANCHSSPLLTDQQTHNIAIPQIGPGKPGGEPYDFGRLRETFQLSDIFAFRTPPLHNVALTGPWMHNGAYDTLEGAVRHHLNPADALQNYNINQLSPLMQEMVINPALYSENILSRLDILLPHDLTLTDSQVDDLLAFLHALTARSALDLRNTIPNSVPSGLPLGD